MDNRTGELGGILANLPRKHLFRVAEVAEYLSVSAQCVRNWCREGKLCAVGPPRARRITRASIIAFVQRALVLYS